MTVEAHGSTVAVASDSREKEAVKHTPEPVLARAMKPINRFVENVIPSALTFAIVLTVIVAIMAMVFARATPTEVVISWGDGLTGLLSFITQMALVLLLGCTLASTKPVKKLLRMLARVPKTALTAYLFVFLIAAIGSLLTWGLGLMVGAIMARYVAVEFDRREQPVSFPMLVASAYSGFVVWHMGFSASAPLTAATPGSFVAEQVGHTIPLSETIFSWWNLAGILEAILAVLITLWLVAPRRVPTEHQIHADVIAEAEEEDAAFVAHTPAEKVDASRVLTTGLGLVLVAYLFLYFKDGGTVTLDIVNWMFLALICLVVSSVHELTQLVSKAASNVGDILLQFPLYAGIMGIMASTGLITVMSDWMIDVANANTLGVLAFLSAGLVNFFVPSGGGQIAVQGPVLLEAAQAIGVDPAIMIMAVSYGDQWTNMIQPFWALPLLALAGLRIRDILGYTTAVLVSTGIVFIGILLVANYAV